MARQLTDLPTMDGIEINDSDLLLIRDTSAKKDKKVSVKNLFDRSSSVLPVGTVIESYKKLGVNDLGAGWVLDSEFNELRTVELIRHYSTDSRSVYEAKFGDISWADDIELVMQVETRADGGISIYVNSTESRYVEAAFGRLNEQTINVNKVGGRCIGFVGMNSNVSAMITLRCVSAPENNDNYRRILFSAANVSTIRFGAGSAMHANKISMFGFAFENCTADHLFVTVTAKRRMGTIFRYKKVE